MGIVNDNLKNLIGKISIVEEEKFLSLNEIRFSDESIELLNFCLENNIITMEILKNGILNYNAKYGIKKELFSGITALANFITTYYPNEYDNTLLELENFIQSENRYYCFEWCIFAKNAGEKYINRLIKKAFDTKNLELLRYVASYFAKDSETLQKIEKITLDSNDIEDIAIYAVRFDKPQIIEKVFNMMESITNNAIKISVIRILMRYHNADLERLEDLFIDCTNNGGYFAALLDYAEKENPINTYKIAQVLKNHRDCYAKNYDIMTRINNYLNKYDINIKSFWYQLENGNVDYILAHKEEYANLFVGENKEPKLKR